MSPAPFDSARAAAALAPLAKLADLPDDKALAALQRLPPARFNEALELLTQAARGPLAPDLSRLLARIASWVAAQNKPVPPDDGSRQWDQTLAARLQAFQSVVRLASALSNVANTTGAGPHHGRNGPPTSWSAGLRLRLLCAAALCTDGAPQVLLAAWHGPRATARRQQEAARLAAAYLPDMLGAAADILEEISSADEPGSVGRLLERSAAASDAKLLAFLHFVAHVAPSMLALALPTGAGAEVRWHLPMMMQLSRLVEARQFRLGDLLANQPAVGIGLLLFALDGVVAAQELMQQLQALVTSGSTSAEARQLAAWQLKQSPPSERHDNAWRNGMSVLVAEPLVPAWRALEEAALTPSLPYAAQAQQLRERVVAAVQQLHSLLGMQQPGQAETDSAAAAKVSLLWLCKQLAASMQHMTDAAECAEGLPHERWLWHLIELVCCGLTSCSSGGSSTGSRGSGSSSSAARAAWLLKQLLHAAKVFQNRLPSAMGHYTTVANMAFERFCSLALPAAADRLPLSTSAGQLSSLLSAVVEAFEAAARECARDLQRPGPREIYGILQPFTACGSLSSGTQALCAMLAAADSSPAAVGSTAAGGPQPAAAAEPEEKVQTGLLALARSLCKLLHSLLAKAAAPAEGLEANRRSECGTAQHAAMCLANSLCALAVNSARASGYDKLPKSARRHLDGTALAALAAADALQATGHQLGQIDDPAVDGDWSELWPGATAAIRTWALAATADPASLPGGDAALAAVLDALPATLVGHAPYRAAALDALAVLVPKVPWVAPELCRRGLLSQMCGQEACKDVRDLALAGRLLQAAAAQLASLPAGQLPAAAASQVAQAARAVADARAGLPEEVWELRHWSSEEVEAAATAQVQRAAEDGGQGQAQDVTVVLHAQLIQLNQAAVRLASAVGQAGEALPQQRSLAGKADEEQQQQLAAARALKPLRCAHLGCTNADGDSEAELPNSKCKACRKVCYCSAQCAAAAWRQHRPACKLMRPREP